MNKSYFIETYGCQMNVADSELVSGLLTREGYTESKDIHDADAIFVNTCAIREHAEDKVHSRLGYYQQIKKKNPGMIIGVLGCMAQNLKDDILESKPYVDIVLGPDSYRRLSEMIRERNGESDHLVDTKLSRFEVYDDMFPSRSEGINAWISIMRGCDKFCTFCIVPFTRGRERSRSLNSIVDEAAKAVADGFVEITLLGQNVNSYNYDGLGFHELLEAVAQFPGLKRIRYTSPHPQDMTQEVLDVMAKHENICNYVHLPLQAGNDRVLKQMNRTYTKKEFITLANKIRKTLPGAGISTDIIVGFPGENEAEFQETIEVMEMIKFDSAFTFKYSSRPGTKAAEFEDHVSESEKQNRLERVIETQKQHTLLRNKELVGRTELVLVEKESKRSSDQWAGRTDSNKLVIFDKGDVQVKDLVPVRIKDARGISLHGEIIQIQEMEGA
ncbi:MAG: tRNA (N6-isopentenyl adenosine(37)-C2)-methylthiotransferase MiaB [Candidatus Marinimicrobia bacterium]|jgi:tRNA-2-methylthio-N6-dimethylallyladenosine synthase|nr:tRNA (N6-isopentenyl adenosine(37)-C2)-methylthiotransferase MiaB [Candidatus Neomarinimicrobiota bacterium]MDP6611689.1 tRNA (N6-isopentenyl adenosine(37)-C2)-methylthiotransferase MiaB [Candidatus Neomarinimicrobiota bacterium]|tara:strand:+ start:101930 stop:103258 length:1329 start_codon:yes stop_codon:yes gene_type:complete